MTARKRTAGTGTVSVLTPGVSFRIRWRDERGQHAETVRGTRPQAEAVLRARLAARDAGAVAVDGSTTLREYVEASYLPQVRPGLAPRSFTRYQDVLSLYVLPELGAYRLDRLRPEQITAAMDRWADAGASAASIRYRIHVLKAVYNRAIRARRVLYNPATLVDLPAYRPAEIRPPTEAQVEAILAAVRVHPYFPAFLLAARTGIRQGELLGLTWGDIDLESGTLAVRRQRGYRTTDTAPTKTRQSVRVIDLDPETVEAIAPYQGQPDEYVARTASGQPIDARNLLRVLHKTTAGLGLPRFRWHDFRHYALTQAQVEGATVQQTMAMAGHARVDQTLAYTDLARMRRRPGSFPVDAGRPPE